MASPLDRSFSTSNVPTPDMGNVVDNMMTMVKGRRTNFERRWYDNNFFDDGYHYRFFSKVANKIVDVSANATTYNPMRAIPKASRQIRGVANLLVSPDYIPVIYPEKIDKTRFPESPMMQQPAPQMGQQQMSAQPQGQQTNPAYETAMQKSKDYAHKVSRWMTKEWENQDLIEKIAQMVILAAKHGVSWMEIWPDAVDEAIKTQVYDAFDIYVMGELTNPYDAPFIIKASPQLISQIKANESFDKEQLDKISPDNKFASSEIKDAYMSNRYNKSSTTDQGATLILKEAFIKEYLNDDNRAMIQLQDDSDVILKGKKDGDPLIRQVFVAGNIWLRDRYVNLPDYPFVAFTFEPGPLYQVPLIERLIPQNKSLDALISRAERYSHTMVTGLWLKQQGQQFEINNNAGGQIVEYNGTPPTQGQIAPIPAFFFELIQEMTHLIEEQGVSTTLGSIPQGVKAHAAIESLKETEYSNLVITSRRLKQCIKLIAEKMLDIADNHFVKPQTVYDMKDGEPNYFDVIGGTALEGRRKLKVETRDDVVPLKKDYKVDIEVSSGMGYTHEGRKAAAKELGDFMIQLAQLQLISPDTVKVYFKQLLDIYSFGPTEEIMESLDNAGTTVQLSENQLMQMKVAVLEALKDAGEVGPEAQQQRLMENKVGVLEALKESGLADNMSKPQPGKVAESISYKDAPEDIKRQIEAQAGLQPSQEPSTDQLDLQAKAQNIQLDGAAGQQKIALADAQGQQTLQMKEQEHNQQMRQAEQTAKLKQVQMVHDMTIKEKISNKPQPKGTNGQK